MNVPEFVGVPLIVIVFDAHKAVTPVGNPVADPIPVAPEVECVILVKVVFWHKVGELDGAPTVLTAVTVIVPVASTGAQLPTNGIL